MYATVEQANEYVQNYYSSVDPIRIQWEALEEADKQVLLNRSEQFIDTLPYSMPALEPGKAFPKDPDQEYSLQQARIATIELTVQKLNYDSADRYNLMKQGVKSYKIGDLSETFGDSVSALNYAGIDPYLLSIVYPFLKDWLGGGYRICPTHIRRCCGKPVK